MVEETEEMNHEGVESSFEELLEQSFVAPERFEPGEKISTEIVGISEEWIFLDILDAHLHFNRFKNLRYA